MRQSLLEVLVLVLAVLVILLTIPFVVLLWRGLWETM